MEIKIPNKTTLRAIVDIDKGKNIKKFDTAEELFEDLIITPKDMSKLKKVIT